MNPPDRIHTPEDAALFGFAVHRIKPANAWQILELLGMKEGDVVVEFPTGSMVLKREAWEQITNAEDL